MCIQREITSYHTVFNMADQQESRQWIEFQVGHPLMSCSDEENRRTPMERIIPWRKYPSGNAVVRVATGSIQWSASGRCQIVRFHQ
ncbi:MAG: hypothetical protein Tsb009_14640 [Planctomycetaceae bacterium]